MYLSTYICITSTGRAHGENTRGIQGWICTGVESETDSFMGGTLASVSKLMKSYNKIHIITIHGAHTYISGHIPNHSKRFLRNP